MAIRPPDDTPADVGDTPFDDLDDALLTAVPTPPDDDAGLDAPDFDAGLLLALKRGELEGPGQDAVLSALADDAGRRALLEHVDQPLPPGVAARMAAELAPRRRRAPLVGGVVTVLALAAAVLIFAQRAPAPPPGFEMPRLSGGVEAVKSSPTGGNLFVPESTLSITLVPFTAVDGPLAARVYESAPPGSALTALPGDGIEQKPGGAIVLRSPARALFGERFGPRVVFIGVALQADALPTGGLDPPSTRAPVDGVRWYAVPVQYRAAP